jgi:hypothetical protein
MHVRNQKSQGRQTRAIPATGSQALDGSEGRTRYKSNKLPPAATVINMKKEMNHINKRPEVGSSTGICMLKLDGQDRKIK